MQDVKNAIMHLKTHQTYPANKDDLVKACEDLKDFSEEDKAWFKENLPNKTFDSAEEVIDALGFKKSMSAQDVDDMMSMHT